MKYCDVCGNDISHLHRQAKRCGYACVLEHKRLETLKKNGGKSTCVICRSKYDRRSSGQKTCSRECGIKLKHSQHKKKLVEIDTATSDVRFNNRFLLAKRA